MESYSRYHKVSLTVFIASFFFIVFTNSDIYGFQAFFTGFQGLYFGEMKLLFPWLSNFAFFASMLTKTGGEKSILLSILSVVLAGSVLFINDMPKYVLDHDDKVPQFGAGYILWLSSFTINLIGAIRDRNALKKGKTIWD